MKNSLIKSFSILSFGALSTPAFAERNPNVEEACAQYKLDAASPLTEFTFDLRNYDEDPLDSEKDVVTEHLKCTVYKGKDSDSKSYYASSEDRDNMRNTLNPVEGIFALPLQEAYENKKFGYKKFFKKCNLKVEEIMWYFVITNQEFDPVQTAYALQKSEWFTNVFPSGKEWFSDQDSDEKLPNNCLTVCSGIEECRKTDPI